MNPRQFKLRVSDANRLRNILVVVFESGGGLLIDRLRLKYGVPLRHRIRQLVHRRRPADVLVREERAGPAISPPVLRSVLERLGPTFVKLGQVLSMRADLVGEAFSGELSKLQSDAQPFSYEAARQIVKEEQGRFPEDLFQSF